MSQPFDGRHERGRFAPVTWFRLLAVLWLAVAPGLAHGAVILEETVTGSSSNTEAVSLIQGGTNQTYSLFIATKDSTDVTGVAGGGLTWTEQKEQCGAKPDTGIRVWIAQGSPAGAFSVVVSLASNSEEAMVLTRYSGISAIEDPTGENTNGENGACAGGTNNALAQLTLTSITNGSIHAVGVAPRDKDVDSFSPGYSLLGSDNDRKTGSYVYQQTFAAATTDTFQATLSKNVDWATAGVVFAPSGGSITTEETVTGSSSNTEVLPLIQGGTNQAYVLYAATKNNTDVTGVAGGGLTWTEQKEQCGAKPDTGIRVWTAQGSPAGAFSVVVSLASNSEAAMVLTRYSGVAAIEDPTGENTNGENGACAGGTNNALAQLTLTSITNGSIHAVGVAPKDKNIDSFSPGYALLGSDNDRKTGSYVYQQTFAAATTDTFQATLSKNVDWATAGVVLRPTLAAVTVDDVSVIEGVGLLFTVTLDNAVGAGFDVAVSLADVTATGGAAPLLSPVDYDNVIANLSFVGSAGETRSFTVASLDDALLEASESFTVALNALDPLVADSDTATGTLTDNDAAAVTVEDVSVIEGVGLLFTVTLDNAVGAGFDVAVSLADVTATGGAAPLLSPVDYDNVIANLSFTGSAGETRSFTVASLDDALLEASESFTVALNALDPLVADSDTATGTLTDNEIPSIDLQLTKTANKDEVSIGDIVSYSVALANTVATDVLGVDVRDQSPPNLKYVAGSARLDGAPLADPAGNRPLIFTIGTVPGLVDTNGNGVADPGEVGYRLLTYKLIVGAGATPGDYDNTATAVDVLNRGPLSNSATARVSVIQDPLFDLGTIIGKVFEDKNEDGIQNLDEPGVPGVMVALDNGTYALTDAHGRYHFPAVTPGQRLIKINLQSIAGNTEATTEEVRVLSVTPGLLVKANFGIRYQHTIEKIGQAGKRGLLIQTEKIEEPISIVGNTENLTVLVNGQIAPLPTSDIQLRTLDIDDVVELNGQQLKAPIVFEVGSKHPDKVKRWRLLIRNSEDEIIHVLSEPSSPPGSIQWDGLGDKGQLLAAGGVYQYQLELEFADGSRSSSARRVFGVNRTTAISLNLSGGAFASGSYQLTARAIKLLKETAQVIRQFPNEKIVVEGHTDSGGSGKYNMSLSKRRAMAAHDYLVNVEKLPADQFIVRWDGESRPIASNETAEGRALNRRVGINGQLTKVERAKMHHQYRSEPAVRVGDSAQSTDADGRFSTQIDATGVDLLDIHITNAQGATVRTSVPLPRLDILPQQTELLPFGAKTSRYHVYDAAEDGPRASDHVAMTYALEGRTAPANVVELNGEPLAVDAEGAFTGKLTLRTGSNTVGLAVRNPAGYTRIANLRIVVSDHDENGPLIVIDPVPNLAVKLPLRDAPITTEQLIIPGETDPGNRVRVNGKPVEVQGDGTFVATVKLPVGESRLVIDAIDPAGHIGSIARTVVRKQGLFLLAFADAKISRLKADGFIEGAGLDEKSETRSEGRVAYYLKGMIKGKYLITSAFDSGTNEFDKLFDDLDETENDRLMTNLDPDKFYPVYGDDSTLVYDSDSQGKFYLALDSDALHVLIGNYAINLSDTELAAYRRTLYGAQLAYESLGETPYGQPHTKAQAFVAEVKQTSVSDELTATGGSLYYLSQRQVIEGSEQVSLVVRDQDTGLELSRTPQGRNIDYTIKYEEGRILFNAPIASV
ncbi:MAG: OmpA family protein, partial [Gammaproteobacteria bacterium]|nr:OmpA family protein [Gammaproteobacteria bacterium]